MVTPFSAENIDSSVLFSDEDTGQCKIYTYWSDGFDKAPEIVRECLRSWKVYHSSWTIVELCDDTIADYIPDYTCIEKAIDLYNEEQCDYWIKMGDILGLLILKQYGGVWIDAGVFCNQCLDKWLPRHFQNGFFTLEAPNEGEWLSSWFMYAKMDNAHMQRWYQLMAHTYNIEGSGTSNTAANDILSVICKQIETTGVSKMDPNYLLEEGLFGIATIANKIEITSKQTPLYKLTCNIHLTNHYKPGTRLFYLISTLSKVLSEVKSSLIEPAVHVLPKPTIKTAPRSRPVQLHVPRMVFLQTQRPHQKQLQQEARQKQLQQEQARQKQFELEQARQKQFELEQARQLQLQQEQARQKQLQQEARQKQLQQEARQKQLQQEARQKQIKLEQARQKQIKLEQARQLQLQEQQARQLQLQQERARQKQKQEQDAKQLQKQEQDAKQLQKQEQDAKQLQKQEQARQKQLQAATQKQNQVEINTRDADEDAGSIPIVIILTTTVSVNIKKEAIYQVNKQDRTQTYLKSIQQWLDKTTFTIVLVENSGYLFDELDDLREQYADRFETVIFDEATCKEAMHLRNNKSKGASELFAIQYAYKHANACKRADFIIKITGRFFIPELETYLSSITIQDYMALIQHDPLRCEMIGARQDVFSMIFHERMTNHFGKINGRAETIFFERIKRLPTKAVIQCDEFDIEPTGRGGVKEIYSTI